MTLTTEQKATILLALKDRIFALSGQYDDLPAGVLADFVLAELAQAEDAMNAFFFGLSKCLIFKFL